MVRMRTVRTPVGHPDDADEYIGEADEYIGDAHRTFSSQGVQCLFQVAQDVLDGFDPYR